jgi:hypothetical protein
MALLRHADHPNGTVDEFMSGTSQPPFPQQVLTFEHKPYLHCTACASTKIFKFVGDSFALLTLSDVVLLHLCTAFIIHAMLTSVPCYFYHPCYAHLRALLPADW